MRADAAKLFPAEALCFANRHEYSDGVLKRHSRTGGLRTMTGRWFGQQVDCAGHGRTTGTAGLHNRLRRCVSPNRRFQPCR